MAPRSWRRTVDIECKDFPPRTASSDVVKWVWDFLANSYPRSSRVLGVLPVLLLIGTVFLLRRLLRIWGR